MLTRYAIGRSLFWLDKPSLSKPELLMSSRTLITTTMQRTVPTDELKQLPAHKRKPCGYEQRLSGLPVCSSQEKTTRSEELGDNRADNL
jgi:hypothetical protein